MKRRNNNQAQLLMLFDGGENAQEKTENAPSPAPVASVRPSGSADMSDCRDELNLAEFPICCLADRVVKGIDTLVFSDTIIDRSENRSITRTLTVSGSTLHGLPTALDGDVILALIQLTRWHSNFTSRTVPISRPEILKILRWPATGQYYDRLEESLNRWVGVTLYYDNAWRDNRRKRWVDEKFHILSRVSLQKKHEDAPEGGSSFTWGEEIFASFQADNLKKFDLDFYFRLNSSVSRRMYRFLDKRFWRKTRWGFDLRVFACEHIGLSRDYQNGEIKRRVLPAIRELEAAGFLEPMHDDERFLSTARGQWQVVFLRKPVVPVGAPQPTDATVADEKAVLIADLVQRGVTSAVAAGLVGGFEPSVVRTRIEVLDWLVENKDQRVRLNPAGYLAASIRKEYEPPPDFTPPSVREKELYTKKEIARHVEAAKVERAAREEQARQAVRSPVESYLAALDPEARQQLEMDAVAGADLQTQERLSMPGPDSLFRKAMLERAIHRHVRKLLGLPETPT